VDQPKLHASSQFGEADWLKPRLRHFGAGVAALVPDGFPAYIRILHPAGGRNGQHIRWAEVARESGAAMHRLVQFHRLQQRLAEPSMIGNPPETGNLPPELLMALYPALAEHTDTADACYFCLWHGYGFLYDGGISSLTFTPIGIDEPPEATRAAAGGWQPLSAALRAAARAPSRVQLPQREYLLFEGPLEAAGELGWFMPGGHFVAQSPNLFWPRDHAWCVASEIDLPCTFVAGSNRLVETLLAQPHLEAWRVFADDPVTADSGDCGTPPNE